MTNIDTYSAIMSRYLMATKLGMQFGGDRDIYKALGYKEKLTYHDYLSQYLRQDMARAIVDRPIQGTWRGKLQILEPGDADTTILETSFGELAKTLQLKNKFMRLDRLASIGHYAVLLIGFDDITRPEDWAEAVSGKRKILYIKPISEASAPIKESEESPQSQRYGQPLYYEVAADKTKIRVHYSRVIHVAASQLEDDVMGTPVLKPVFNRLKDLEKLVGGSAEMFWKGAFPGYQGKIKDDYQIDAETKKDLKDQLDEYEHGLRRFLIAQGVDLSPMASQVADPRNHVDIQVQMISAQTGIPKRILTGTERGELASSEDKGSWNELLQTRREEHAEPTIVRPFIDKCIEHGVLPGADYEIAWSDLFAAGEKEKAEVGKVRASAIKEYLSQPLAAEIIPPAAFMEFMLGFDRDQIELINEMVEASMDEEDLVEEEPEAKPEGDENGDIPA